MEAETVSETSKLNPHLHGWSPDKTKLNLMAVKMLVLIKENV
jgi:hypothetical protein